MCRKYGKPPFRRPMNSRALASAVALLSLISSLSSSPAVVIASADGTGNTTAPADDPGFANVGSRGNGSAIYLGDRWVLTAAHVGAGSVTLQSTTYTAEVGTDVRLTNSGGGVTDLVLFRLQTDPGLPTLTFSTTRPTLDTPVVMIGAGRDREVDQTQWLVVGDPPSWTEVMAGGNAFGYHTNSNRTLRWGENTVSTDTNEIVNVGWGDVESYRLDFDSGNPDEGHGVRGDSGGAVFFKNGGNWELTGLMHANASFTGQPADTAVFGNYVAVADLAAYNSQILAVIPEPSSALLILLGFGLATVHRRKR